MCLDQISVSVTHTTGVLWSVYQQQTWLACLDQCISHTHDWRALISLSATRMTGVPWSVYQPQTWQACLDQCISHTHDRRALISVSATHMTGVPWSVYQPQTWQACLDQCISHTHDWHNVISKPQNWPVYFWPLYKDHLPDGCSLISVLRHIPDQPTLIRVSKSHTWPA